jgi:hypothetical protein
MSISYMCNCQLKALSGAEDLVPPGQRQVSFFWSHQASITPTDGPQHGLSSPFHRVTPPWTASLYLKFRPVSELPPELPSHRSRRHCCLQRRAPCPRRWRSLPPPSPLLPAQSKTSTRTSITAAQHSSAPSPSVSDTGAAPFSLSLASLVY